MQVTLPPARVEDHQVDLVAAIERKIERALACCALEVQIQQARSSATSTSDPAKRCVAYCRALALERQLGSAQAECWSAMQVEDDVRASLRRLAHQALDELLEVDLVAGVAVVREPAP